MSELIDLPEQEVARRASAIADEMETFARSYVVKSDEDYANGADDLKRVKAKQKQLEDQRVSMTGPLNESLKRINEMFRGPKDRLAAVENTIKRQLLAWQAEVERKRREEQARLDEAARREREKLAKQAEKAEAAGKVEKAAELEERAATVVAPIVTTAPPKVAGVSARDVWKFEIIDPTKINASCMIPDEKKIRAIVTSMKGDAADVIGPGVRVWCEKSLAAGSR